MSAHTTDSSSPLRFAETAPFEDGVSFAAIERVQASHVASMRSQPVRDGILACVKAVLMIAPLAGLALPLGGIDFGRNFASEGFEGAGLATMAMVCFALGVLGQAWVILDWFRLGRPRSALWMLLSAATLVAAGVALWWFPSLMHPRDAGLLAPFAIVLGVLAAIALVAQVVASTSVEVEHVRLRKQGERMRALSQAEQAALLEERSSMLAALRSRGLLTEAQEREAAGARLGELWMLDGGSRRGRKRG